MSKLYVNWTDVAAAAEYITSLTIFNKPDFIVGLTRGGLVPAVILSNNLGIPLVPVSYSSKIGEGEYKGYKNELPKIINPIHSGIGELDIPSLLIVDDLVDSGNTMQEVVGEYRKRGHEVRTATLYHKYESRFKPDIVKNECPPDTGWIVFPWEY